MGKSKINWLIRKQKKGKESKKEMKKKINFPSLFSFSEFLLFPLVFVTFISYFCRNISSFQMEERHKNYIITQDYIVFNESCYLKHSKDATQCEKLKHLTNEWTNQSFQTFP